MSYDDRKHAPKEWDSYDRAELIEQPSVSPGKRTLTMSLPPRPVGARVSAQQPVQQKTTPESQRASSVLTGQWMDAAVRPDQHDAPVQRKAADIDPRDQASSLPADGVGQPMPEDVQAKMETAFGADFSVVRVHEGQRATALGALAYTQGTDIHFARGQYDPGSQRGQQLLGHELTHVVQQSRGRVRATTQAKGVGVNMDTGLEREADELGARAAAGEPVYGQARGQAEMSGRAVERGDVASDVLPASRSGLQSVQRQEASEKPAAPQRSAQEMLEQAIQVIETALAAATGDLQTDAPNAANTQADASGATGETSAGAAAAPQQASPQVLEHLQTALQELLALRGAADEQIRPAVTPILAHVGIEDPAGDAGGSETGATPPVQGNTLVLGAPLLAGGPPGWVAYAVLGVATVGIMGYAAYQTYRTRAQERERAEPRVVPRTRDEPQQHRGRIQVQGGGLELSFPWARPAPMTKAEGLSGLLGLQAMLSRSQLADRSEAFESAAAFIAATLHTCPPDISRTFQNRAVRQRRGDERVDVEIRTGIAFV